MDAYQDVARLQSGHWRFADVGKHVILQPAGHFLARALGTLGGSLFHPHARYEFKGLSGSKNLFQFCFMSGLERVQTVRDQTSRLGVSSARLWQCDGGVDPERNCLALAQVAVVKGGGTYR